jgi:hypothetical protein
MRSSARTSNIVSASSGASGVRVRREVTMVDGDSGTPPVWWPNQSRRHHGEAREMPLRALRDE